MRDEPNVKVTMLLCEFAQEINGKLYILGGGWSRMVKLRDPIQLGLAIKLLIPWHLANEKMQFRAALLTQDGQSVTHQGQPVQIEGSLEVGRPPGLKQGTYLDSAMAFNLSVPMELGAYRWDFSIGNHVLAQAPFEVSAPPQSPR
jgi:hypothetical protein